jgi:ectoine hydroxylase-related dioxygenase (phytanoyl-CoA dioxygenase family)
MNAHASTHIDAALAAYAEHGYVVLPSFLTEAETEELRAVTDRIEASAIGVEQDNQIFDFEAGHTPDAPKIQRIKKPNRVDPYYRALAAHPRLIDIVARIIGPNIRLNHSKINMKTARVGAALEWHQDWAFAPHSNMSTCVVSVMIDACHAQNGPVLVVPGSHRGRLLEHHQDGVFVGAVVDDGGELPDYATAAPLLGPAGSVAIHHPMAVHGSAANRSGAPRRILFLEYAATDAWPLFYHVDWEEYDSRIVAGPATSLVRAEANAIKLPFPNRSSGSIYKTQAALGSRFFET